MDHPTKPSKFATDSLVEEAGFEPSVPLMVMVAVGTAAEAHIIAGERDQAAVGSVSQL